MGKPKDPVDAAIDAVESPPQIQMLQVKVTLGEGRFVMLAIAPDITPLEMVEFVGWLTGDGLRTVLAEHEAAVAPSPLIVPLKRLII